MSQTLQRSSSSSSDSSIWPSVSISKCSVTICKQIDPLFILSIHMQLTSSIVFLFDFFSKEIQGTSISRWWGGSVCWKASVCCKPCPRWRPGLHLHPHLLFPEVEMGCGPSQESVILSVMGICRLPLPLHRQPVDLETTRRAGFEELQLMFLRCFLVRRRGLNLRLNARDNPSCDCSWQVVETQNSALKATQHTG